MQQSWQTLFGRGNSNDTVNYMDTKAIGCFMNPEIGFRGTLAIVFPTLRPSVREREVHSWSKIPNLKFRVLSELQPRLTSEDSLESRGVLSFISS